MSIGKRIKNARISHGLTQRELADGLGAKHNSVSNWESDKNKPDADMIVKLCEVLNLSPSFLMCGERGLDRIDNILTISKRRIPLVGEIACGQPIVCNRDFESYVETGSDIRADFALRAKGDSMINARIKDGDIVFVRKQPMVENGEIAAVCIGDEATLKRVYVSENTVTLVAENAAYAPIVYNLTENNDIIILGKAIAFQSDLS